MRDMRRPVLVGMLVLMALLVGGRGALAQDRRVVTVGGYEFPPYVELDRAGGSPQGLTIDLLALLNEAQDKWDFQFFLTSPPRRYRDFAAGAFDMIAFESPEWGWTASGQRFEASKVFFEDSEVYVARKAEGRGQTYFDDFSGKRMAGILGYHYGFAEFNADPAVLKDKFAMMLVTDHAASIEVVLRDRADVAVVTKSYLLRYLARNATARDQLLVSDKVDQVYRLQILTNPAEGPAAAELDGLLEVLETNGRLPALFDKAGVIGS